MTDEEIKKIAYYISEKRHKEEEVSDSTTFIFPIDIYEDIVTKLSERYCLVSKSKVKEWEEIVKDSLKADHVITENAFRFMWERLFGKDMFEEGKI